MRTETSPSMDSSLSTSKDRSAYSKICKYGVQHAGMQRPYRRGGGSMLACPGFLRKFVDFVNTLWHNAHVGRRQLVSKDVSSREPAEERTRLIRNSPSVNTAEGFLFDQTFFPAEAAHCADLTAIIHKEVKQWQKWKKSSRS